MSGERGTLELLARQLVALEPLRRAVTDEHAFRALMLRLGWQAAGLPPAYTAIGESVAAAAQAIDALDDKPSLAQIAELLHKTRTAYENIRAIDTAPPGVDAPAFLADIGERLFEILLTDYLASEQPAAFNLLSTLNVIEGENIEPTAGRRGYVRTRFKWEEIPRIIELDLGSLYRTRSLVVTDTFGVAHADRAFEHTRRADALWRMFQLSYTRGSGLAAPASNLFFLPPSLLQGIDSAPVEEVLFLRDEMANLPGPWNVSLKALQNDRSIDSKCTGKCSAVAHCCRRSARHQPRNGCTTVLRRKSRITGFR